jgi:glucose/arabinose dehydrogenase
VPAWQNPGVVARSLSIVVLLVLVTTGCTNDVAVETSTTTAPEPTTSAAIVSTTTVATTATTTTAPTTTTTLPPLKSIALAEVASGLDQPVLLTSPPGDDRRFVVERRGVVRIIGQDRPFLDISDLVNSEDGIEPGLLGLAFHPDYGSNGRFFVFYYRSAAPQTRLAEYRVSSDPDVADPGSEKEILTFDKPTNRHNGGMLEFGPEGYLYVSLGEGGAASVNAQNPNTLLSAILRLDVDNGDPYAVPADNPFVAGGGAPEVWAYGFRNPWRFSIDPATNAIYIADVGHEEWEEIDTARLDSGGGMNFGWLRMEGSHCFQSGCDPVAEDLTLPIYEYSHAEGCAVTGGYVYRGTLIPELEGEYLFGDWCGGWIRALTISGSTVSEPEDVVTDAGQIDGFGRDAQGELYVLTWDGTVSKIVAIR